jgi:hypothetical protein
MTAQTQLLTRTSAVVTRLELAAGGKAQAIGQSHGTGKPGSIIPDMTVLTDRYQIEAPLWQWLGRADVKAGPLMVRFRLAIMDADARALDELAGILAQAETRMRIKWTGTAHEALPPIPLDELRETRQRMILFEGFGLGLKEAAKALGFTRDDIRHVRRSHGISGLDGTRRTDDKSTCPEALITHQSTEYCRVCQVVDDRMAERTQAA